jgi:hypothetical protein
LLATRESERESRKQKAEIRRQKAEGKGQKSEGRSQKPETRNQNQKAEAEGGGRRQKAKAEGRWSAALSFLAQFLVPRSSFLDSGLLSGFRFALLLISDF